MKEQKQNQSKYSKVYNYNIIIRAVVACGLGGFFCPMNGTGYEYDMIMMGSLYRGGIISLG
jgi:hypothetical protein